ncbi:MAG: hypothetical protein EOP06_13785 [Proteobacteria bacterium]|nr:MAG: hypothetical protein EOP06_13785 [Pseudomonadota bacterium]
MAFDEEAKLVYGVILSLRNMVKKLSGTIITCLENRLEKISYCRRRAPEIDAGFFEQVCNGFSYEAYRINRAAPEEIGSETLRNLIWALEGTHDAEPIINSIRRVNGWITSPEDCSARIGSRAGAVVLGKTEGEEANSVVDSWIKLLLLAWSMMEIREILSRLDLAALRNQMKRLSEAVGKIVVEQFEDADQRLAYGRLGSEIDAVLSWADGNRRLSNLISPAFNQADKRKDSFQNALSLRLFEFCRCVEELRDNLESFDWLGGSLIASTLLDSLTKDLNRARSNIKPFSQNLRKMGEQAGTQLLEGIMTPRELPKEIDANRLFKFASDHRIGSVGKVPLERLRSTIPQHGK